VHRGGDVYGDGVNIASRIEPLAGAGGICVSMDVERQIRNALEARFERLGTADLKNVQLPMELFRIVLPWEQTQGGAPKAGDAKTMVANWSELGPGPLSRMTTVSPLVPPVVVAFAAAFVWWFAHQSQNSKGLTPGPAIRSPRLPAVTNAPPAPDQKSIAVL